MKRAPNRELQSAISVVVVVAMYWWALVFVDHREETQTLENPVPCDYYEIVGFDSEPICKTIGD